MARPPRKHQTARALFRRGWRRLRGGQVTPWRAALSMALGVWIGCIPVFGVHGPVCLAICLPLRMDGAIGLLGTQISNPLFAPGLLWVELQVGAILLTGRLARVHGALSSGDVWGRWPLMFLVGAPVVATALAIVLGGVAAAAARMKLVNGSGR